MLSVVQVDSNLHCHGLPSRLRGAGDNGPVSTVMASSFLDAAGTIGRVAINEQIEEAGVSGGS